MNIVDAFDVCLNEHELICLVGAGGKTTTMFALAQALKSLNKRVLVTTTTHIFYPGNKECDTIIVNDTADIGIFHTIPEGTVTVFGSGVVNEAKLAGVDEKFVEQLYQQKIFDYILVECDGSKQKPIKAPAHYEPIVPDNVTRAIGVIGLDAVGNPINEEYVHRLKLFCNVVKRPPGEILDEEAVVNLIVSPQGLFKGVPDGCRKYVVLNKAENAQRRTYAENILIRLMKRDYIPFTTCVIASMTRNRVYL
ncbi:MAG: putative selenium-dependent hydroxylase accessory protein YqeC [Syntrophobacteraceae bacterium CG23_combo_of_CG06-09_8_20_14_all_50_8]|nr:MAG: putative selenium-dependent hydroxylase accessory protein YqeC [Syntrophobacteraceae bacterium CG23_combo_of_CG06-09_8_20_14_all_50_8]